jgi:hypothetical protein
VAAVLHESRVQEPKRRMEMGYIIAWLLGVPVTLLILFWLFFGR